MTTELPEDHGDPNATEPLALRLSEGLGPLVEVLARWEDQNGTMAAVLPSEWDSLRQEVMDACVLQSPRMLRAELLMWRTLAKRALPMADALDATKTAVVWTGDLQIGATMLARDIRAALRA